MEFSPDSRTLAIANTRQETQLWNIQSGQHIHTLVDINDVQRTEIQFSPTKPRLSFSPDGKTLATIAFDMNNRKVEIIELWNTDTRELQTTFFEENQELTDPVSSVRFSADGNSLISVNRDGTGREWNIETGENLTLFEDVEYGEFFLPPFLVDKTSLISVTPDGTVQMWNTETGKIRLMLKGYGNAINSAVLSADGTTLITVHGSQGLRLWDMHSRLLKATIAGDFHLTPLVLIKDNRTLAYPWEKDIRLFDTHTQQEIATLSGHKETVHINNIRSIVLSPNGQTLASNERNMIRLWDIRSGEHTKTLQGHAERINSIAFSPDGTMLVSGSKDGTVLLWKMKPTFDTRLNITPHIVESPRVGESITFNINLVSGQGVTDYQFTLQYDLSALRYIPNRETDQPMIVASENTISIAGNSTAADGLVATVTFEVLEFADSTITMTDNSSEQKLSVPVYAWVVKPTPIHGDVNEDWQLNEGDLEFVSARLGQTGKDMRADVNRDGVVDLADLVFVANALNGTLPKPPTE